MNACLRLALSRYPACRRTHVRLVRRMALLVIALTTVLGCGRGPPPATVEGTLRLNGRSLDNCLITFLPEPGEGLKGPHSTGLTDRSGAYRLRFDDQREGASTGWHCVTVQDLSVSTGVRRRDHGTVDAEMEETAAPPHVRPLRVPQKYTSPAETPLRKEVAPGHQVIDLEIK
jgi:hypothetical protein